MQFSDKDIEQLKQLGISPETVKIQILQFQQGFKPMFLAKAAILNDGIITIDKDQTKIFEDYYTNNIENITVLKFVPASGAASRMFKALFELMEKLKNNEKVDIPADNNPNSLDYFFKNIRQFAFFEKLSKCLTANNVNIDDCLTAKSYLPILEYLLTSKGLNYGNLPKALLDFHQEETVRTALEEHLVEGAEYAGNKGKVTIHFTVSPEHLELFKQKIKEVQAYYEKRFNVNYDLSYSIQKPSTDTIAVDLHNTPVRDNNNKLIFRQGGHGALIANLNDLNDDIVFIKNIDNITTDKNRTDTITYKKVIAGYLLKVRKSIYEYLTVLENKDISEEEIKEIYNYCIATLMIRIKDFDQLPKEEKRQTLFTKLNRPVRICGMVKNEGEPGGGPFWTQNAQGGISLQIVESSQVNLNDEQQKKIWNEATHFNPVDLVCSLKDHKGNHFDLNNFIDQNTGFISEKSFQGTTIKALELPGLWNGAMADWITIFMEVPITIFSPVKTVNDLLRREHQS